MGRHRNSPLVRGVRNMLAISARRSGGMVDDMGAAVLAEAGPAPRIKPPRAREGKPPKLTQLPPSGRFFASLGSDRGQADDMEERVRLLREMHSVRICQVSLLTFCLGLILGSGLAPWLWGAAIALVWGWQ